jgi:hypothetical protein
VSLETVETSHFVQIQWLDKEDFWKPVADRPNAQTRQDAEFHFQLPLHEIRARIRSAPPEFTPDDECDFPGPVERWYGIVDGHRFMMTYCYSSPVADCVTVQHEPSEAAAAAVSAAIETWRLQRPY